MYVTRPLSLYKRSPEAAEEVPPKAPYSGYLVVADEEWEAEARCCFGLCKCNRLDGLPFPQNKILTVQYTQSAGETTIVDSTKTLFIPVLDKPLSSNLYYVVMAHGKYKGNTCTCSREVDMKTCCFCRCIKDVKPIPFDHRDIYQQMQIFPRSCSSFSGKSTAPDGFPPYFIRRRGWEAYASTSHGLPLNEANGVDPSLRAKLPNFEFPIGSKYSTPSIVGKWYCPFIFIREMSSLKAQMECSMFYEMCLEQFWEEIHTRDNYGNEGDAIAINAHVRKENALLFGQYPVHERTSVEDGVVWFKPLDHANESDGVGLSVAIMERIKWEAASGGWIDTYEREVKVERVEECKGGTSTGGWRKFGCYVLVERFALKRLDGTLVLTYDFKHSHRIQSKWE